MAIKGKRKTRGRPRTVASAPRPFLVPPRTPPLRRRPIQVLLILFALGAFVAVGAGLRASQDATQRKEEVQQFGAQVNALLQASGIAPAIGPTPVVLPQLATTIAEVGKREPKGLNTIAEDAESWATGAANTADDIGAIQVDESESRVALLDSRELMVQGLSLYASIARQLSVVSGLDDDGTRAELASSLEAQVTAAGTIFATGWDKLTREEQLVGLPVRPLAPPGGLPPGGLPGGGFPAP